MPGHANFRGDVAGDKVDPGEPASSRTGSDKETRDMTDDQLLDRITTDTRIMAGKPVIRGTRLAVEYVLSVLGHGATVDEILEEYQGLTREDVRACLLFASRSLEASTVLPLHVDVP